MSLSEFDPLDADLTDVVDTDCDLDVADEETAITEISFLPDGRICLFGASREVLELLGSLDLGDERLNSRLACLPSPTNAKLVAEVKVSKVTEIQHEAVQVHE